MSPAEIFQPPCWALPCSTSCIGFSSLRQPAHCCLPVRWSGSSAHPQSRPLDNNAAFAIRLTCCAISYSPLASSFLAFLSGISDPAISTMRRCDWPCPLGGHPDSLSHHVCDRSIWLESSLGPTGARVPFWRLLTIRTAGEVVNMTTPTAYMGGEPLKAYLLKKYNVPIAEGAASVVIAKTTLTIAEVFYILTGSPLDF